MYDAIRETGAETIEDAVSARRMVLAYALLIGAGGIDGLVQGVLEARDAQDAEAAEAGDEDEDTLEDPYEDYLDGDHDSAMTSIGWGTDEDYGYFGGDDGGW